MNTRTLRRVVQDFRKRKARASFVADMLGDAADAIDALRAVHAASLRRVRWILVGALSVAHVGNCVAVIRWKGGGKGDVFLLRGGTNVSLAALTDGRRIGSVSGYTPGRSAARLLRRAK